MDKKSAGDELLTWASEMGSGTWEKMKDAMDFLAMKHDFNMPAWRFAELLSSLGHLDVDYEKSRWSIAKPTLNLIPGMGRMLLLTGSRPFYFLKNFERATSGLEFYPESFPQKSPEKFQKKVIAPQSMFVSCDTIASAKEVAEAIDAKFVVNPAERLLESFTEGTMELTSPPFQDQWEYFDVKSLSFRKEGLSPEANFKVGLYKEVTGVSRYLWFDQDWFTVTLPQGQAKALQGANEVALEWFPPKTNYGRINQESRLRVSDIYLHYLVERSLVMCSGFLPNFQSEGKKFFRTYKNVPKGLVKQIETKLGLRVNYGDDNGE